MAAPHIFDRALLAERLARRDPEADFVSALVRDDLAERLLAVSRRFEQALIMAPDARVLPYGGVSAAGPFVYERAGTLVAAGAAPIDPEAPEPARTGYDLVVSLLDLSIVDDVPGFLARIRRHLRPDGLFLAAVLGGDTLTELRQAFLAADAQTSGGAFARVAPFLQLADAGPLLQRTGFALPVTDLETQTVRYGDPLALMRDLKALGAANPLADRPSRPMSARTLAAAAEAYAARFTDPDGRIRATLEVVWMSGWAPHESQQKPLRPGSAEVSLTKVLGKGGT